MKGKITECPSNREGWSQAASRPGEGPFGSPWSSGGEIRRAVGPPLWDKEVRAGLLREIRVVPRKSVAFRPVAAGGKAFLFGRKQYEGTTGKSETRRSGCLSGCQRDGGPGKHPGKVLGEKGELTALLKQMGKLSAEERPIIGQLANEIREKLTNEIESQKKNWRRSSWKPRCRQRRWTSPPWPQAEAGAPAPHVHCPGRD